MCGRYELKLTNLHNQSPQTGQCPGLSGGMRSEFIPLLASSHSSFPSSLQPRSFPLPSAHHHCQKGPIFLLDFAFPFTHPTTQSFTLGVGPGMEWASMQLLSCTFGVHKGSLGSREVPEIPTTSRSARRKGDPGRI